MKTFYYTEFSYGISILSPFRCESERRRHARERTDEHDPAILLDQWGHLLHHVKRSPKVDLERLLGLDVERFRCCRLNSFYSLKVMAPNLEGKSSILNEHVESTVFFLDVQSKVLHRLRVGNVQPLEFHD